MDATEATTKIIGSYLTQTATIRTADQLKKEAPAIAEAFGIIFPAILYAGANAREQREQKEK
ncbi:MAG: hypothetical protein WBW16_05360 [Bacteroidota bacterium]